MERTIPIFRLSPTVTFEMSTTQITDSWALH